MSNKLECEKCGNKLYRIKDFCLDRDGMREAAYCDYCSIIYRVTSSRVSIYKVLKPQYGPTERESIIHLCESIIEDVKNN